MAEDKKPKKHRRIVANPETVRERGEHQRAKAAKPKKANKIKHVLAWPFAKVGHFFAWLNRIKVFRWIGYIVVPVYFRNSLREVRLVTWPDAKQTRQLTTAVIIFAVIFGVLVAVVDYGLDHAFKKFILKQ